MAFIRFYAGGSVILGLSMALDMAWMITAPLSRYHVYFSRVEYSWLLLSIVAVIVLVREERSILVPVSYISYTLLTWVHAFYLVYRGVVDETFELPLWVVMAGTTFGCGFAVIAGRLLWKSVRHWPAE